MTGFIDAHRDRFGVESICRVLQFAPSTYYGARRLPPSARHVRDGVLKVELRRVHAEQFGVYGVRKLWRRLHTAKASRWRAVRWNGSCESWDSRE